ncbi:NAD(P)-dependent dehydrogenase, short-chain alcohol dehydrogenase family [Arboricoccus pini]|uniref:NAD(P)-dependent dehydrogenase, short-chain alcohol dehydrogenase family n=1 Tax=Arboricoccus pini TaxID=1963835 RepID=A0A212QYZ6_9PROT|nr:glucose 1-dehydrogenase [Arboricoccus pini]SNB64940.1 NAD(P)-dependent dehydrogenase, short-chain alcohol dehydrogenase family [Arboricoccus pini]
MYLEMFNLKGRTAVVTGGGQGIGFACAQALGEAGAKVVVAELLADRVEKAVAELKALGVDAYGAELDVTDSKAVADLAAKVAADHGGASILVNNAGIAFSDVKAEDTSDEHWAKHFRVNVDGVFYCCREFGKLMLAAGKGSVVNIGSMSGFIVNKPQPQSFYNASKAAVHHLTKSLACEWGARGVRVNSVAPTYIETPLTLFGAQNQEMLKTWLDMTPMGRMGQPHEIASTVLFLASDASSLLTGSIIAADGGYTCW